MSPRLEGGRDANGGYAEYAVVPQAYAYRLPKKLSDALTANTRADGEGFLRLAGLLRVRPTVTVRALIEADRAWADLAADRVTGAAVLAA